MLKSIIIFVVAYGFIISEKFPRHWVALIGGALLIISGVLTPTDAITYINWETLGLLSGMFVLVSILNEAGFFSWLAMTAIRKVNYQPAPLFIVLILLACNLSMFMDSITVMLFLSALTLQLTKLLKIDPIPVIIAEVCAANVGGAATLMGDPPNVILGTTLGFTFNDFAANTGPISAITAGMLMVVFYFINRRSLRNARDMLNETTIAQIEQLHNENMHAHMTRVGLIGFGIAVFLLVFHLPLSALTGLPVNAATAALVPAVFSVLFLKPGDARNVILKVDGESILFFGGLFLLIGGLEKAEVFSTMAGLLAGASDSQNGLVLVLHWIPGLASGILDNVPLALAMSYVLEDLARLPGMPALGLMVWALALGVDIGGNLTPIGASANVVAYSYMERNYGKVGWKRWLVIAVPPTLIAMVMASLMVVGKGMIGWY
ncbi:MAG: citrate transporter [Leptolinea sp.]|jgi:Na+/H+ antiporter NhaD/arsenite permease-like protein|nr:citrate transporter [Leptolinea sp.]